MGHFGPKIAHPHNYRSAGRIFTKFYKMKRANTYMRLILIISKKIFFRGQMDHFELKNGAYL